MLTSVRAGVWASPSACSPHHVIPISLGQAYLSLSVLFRVGQKRKINLQAPRFSAVFSSQLSSLSKALPSPSHAHCLPLPAKHRIWKTGKPATLQSYSSEREHHFGYIPPPPNLLNCQILQQVALLISVPWGCCLTNYCFFDFKNST